MKHLKTFENINDDNCYWALPTDDRFEESLKMIGCEPYYIEIMLNSYDDVRRHKYVFIRKQTSNKRYPCGWDAVEDNINSSFFDKMNYEFKGVVNAPELELLLTANKYNL
jgi:hypothetical protein